MIRSALASNVDRTADLGTECWRENGASQRDQALKGATPTTIECEACGNSFSTNRPGKRFCSNSCRKGHWGDRNVIRITFPKFPPLKPNTPLTTEEPNVPSA